MPIAQAPPAEVGTDAGGFRIAGSAQGTLRITIWGYWSPDIARAFAKDGPVAIQKLGASSTFVLDANELKPQGPDGQEAIRTLFRGLSASSLEKGLALATNALARMQLARLIRECSLDSKLEFGDNWQKMPGAPG